MKSAIAAAMKSAIETRSEGETEFQSDSGNDSRSEYEIESLGDGRKRSFSLKEESAAEPRVRKTTETAWESSVKADPSFSTAKQEVLRSKLGLASPDMLKMIEESEFISLGSHCRVAMALENMGLRKCAYPFDYVRSSAEGVLQCLETDFADYCSYTKIHNQGSSKFFYGSKWGGSFWHHDIEDAGVCASFGRRIDRFLGGSHLDGLTNRVFVRVANNPQELAMNEKLLEVLQRKMPQVCVKLLVIIDMQKSPGLLHVESSSPNLIFWRVHEDLWMKSSKDLLEQRHHIADTYAVGIAAAMKYWVQGQQPRNRSTPLRNFSMLNAIVAHFEGGDCNNELYQPQRLKEPCFVIIPQGVNGGNIKTKAFGQELMVPIPYGCRSGQKLELRLEENKAVSVRLAAVKSA